MKTAEVTFDAFGSGALATGMDATTEPLVLAANPEPDDSASRLRRFKSERISAALWLRISRSDRVWAFHASADGVYWRMVRYFTLGEASGARVGFIAQSPLGEGCTAIFDAVTFKASVPADLRDGS